MKTRVCCEKCKVTLRIEGSSDEMKNTATRLVDDFMKTHGLHGPVTVDTE